MGNIRLYLLRTTNTVWPTHGSDCLCAFASWHWGEENFVVWKQGWPYRLRGLWVSFLNFESCVATRIDLKKSPLLDLALHVNKELRWTSYKGSFIWIFLITNPSNLLTPPSLHVQGTELEQNRWNRPSKYTWILSCSVKHFLLHKDCTEFTTCGNESFVTEKQSLRHRVLQLKGERNQHSCL